MMTQRARDAFKEGMKDVDNLISIIEEITGKRRGPITDERAKSLIRSSVVTLCSALEAFIEELFVFAVKRKFPDLDEDAKRRLLNQTIGRFNVPDQDKTDRLFIFVGIPFITNKIRWQNMANDKFKRKLRDLIKDRGKVAHGQVVDISLTKLRNYKVFCENYVENLEKCIRNSLNI